MSKQALAEQPTSKGNQSVQRTRALNTQPIGINPLVQAALTQDIDPEKLDKLLSVQKDYEANEAKKAFHVAMSDFREIAPVLERDSKVGFENKTGGNTFYRHTSLGHAMRIINPLMSQCGLSPNWKTAQGDGGRITVTCTITHAMGHSESTSLTASPDDSGKKNNIQAIGSTLSYLERYTLFSICGLASGHDDDGNAANSVVISRISKEQVQQIIDVLPECPDDTRYKILEWLKIDSLDQIPESAFDQVWNGLEKKRSRA